jgi:hypothetical protein
VDICVGVSIGAGDQQGQGAGKVKPGTPMAGGSVRGRKGTRVAKKMVFSNSPLRRTPKKVREKIKKKSVAVFFVDFL